jgi:transposase
MDFTPNQKALCVLWYAQTSSQVSVQRQYRAHYGRLTKTPSRQNIINWYKKFLNGGSVHRKKRTNTKWVINDEAIEHVIDTFINAPHSSARQMANRDEMPSERSIRRILKIAKFHPYKIQRFQELRPQDHEKRVLHAQNQLTVMQDDTFLNKLLFSDEAHFHLHGGVNKQDYRYWSNVNPHWFREEPLHSPRITVWAAIGREGVYGPFFFVNNVTGANYLDMLQHRFLPEIQQLPNFAQLIFMQDGAPPHWSTAVRNFLTVTFPNRWMGRGSPNLPWPPYSPDLTPMDFFLWGYIKSRVYTTPIENLAILRERIEKSFDELPIEMVNNAIDSYKRRLARCIETNGKSVECR